MYNRKNTLVTEVSDTQSSILAKLFYGFSSNQSASTVTDEPAGSIAPWKNSIIGLRQPRPQSVLIEEMDATEPFII